MLIYSLFYYNVNSSEIIRLPPSNFDYLMMQLQHVQHFSYIDSVSSIIGLQHYYTATKHQITGAVPFMIDKAWHLHILNTEMYWNFTMSTFGHYVHHLIYGIGNMDDLLSTSEDEKNLRKIPALTYWKIKLDLPFIDDLNETVWIYDQNVDLMNLNKKKFHEQQIKYESDRRCYFRS